MLALYPPLGDGGNSQAFAVAALIFFTFFYQEKKVSRP